MIIVLAKYFSRRHIEIRNIRHIIVSGVYAFILFFLILLQPDFGGAIIIFAIWFGMVLVSGISKKHLMLVFTVGVVAVSSLWLFVFVFARVFLSLRASGRGLLSGRHRQRVDETYGIPTLQGRLVGGVAAIAQQGVLG